MRVLAFAWRSLVRQPARSALGVLGVAAVGALLLDMLLLSNGLVTSMRDLLARTGFDIRVTSTGDVPRSGNRIPDASKVARTFEALPEVSRVVTLRFAAALLGDADASRGGRPTRSASDTADGVAPRGSERDDAFDNVSVQAVGGSTGASQWTILRGRDASVLNEVVANRALIDDLGVEVGQRVPLRIVCRSRAEVLPAATMHVVGVADFPLAIGDHLLGMSMDTLDAACGGNSADQAEAILVQAAGDVDRAVEAMKRIRPDLRPMTNAQVLGRLQRTGFTYFQQISAVLTTVTLSFALLLITVLLTVSVNQRLGEIAALRALGFSRGRVVADVLCESVLIVGLGGLLSLPLGLVMAEGLDRILKDMPGIPAAMHFFVFQREALVWHGGLLGVTAIAAALYPMRLVASLPIATTLRNEITS